MNIKAAKGELQDPAEFDFVSIIVEFSVVIGIAFFLFDILT